VARAPTDYHYFDPMSVGVSTKPRRAIKPSKIRDAEFVPIVDGVNRILTDQIPCERSDCLHGEATRLTAQIHEMRGALSERTLQDWLGWKMTVVDANGKTVLRSALTLALDR